ncbi:MAG: glycosyltransferase family 4 protein [bacterium]
MKKVILLQKYIAPYRIPLFNNLAQYPDVDFTMVYYGTKEKRRIWTHFPQKRFPELQSKCLSIKVNYEQNIELPVSVLTDLNKLRPDITICAPDFGGIAAYLYSKKSPKGKYIIWSEATHTTERKVSSAKKYLRKFIFNNADKFIVPGQLAKNYIYEYVPLAPIIYANNSINENNFTISKEQLYSKFSGDKLIITFSGSLVERKGIILLLNAFKGLMKEKSYLKERCFLRIMGVGPLDLSAYREENISLEGFCEGERYCNLMKESHIFILPSLQDPNPLTVIEGLFSGNIIIVSDGVGNYPEAVRDNGLVIQSGSSAQIRKALDFILNLPREKLTEMALNSLALSETFTTKKSLEGFVSALGLN